MRAAGSQGGRPKKLCDLSDSPIQQQNISHTESEYEDEQDNLHPAISESELPTISNEPTAPLGRPSHNSVWGNNSGTGKGPSKSTLWRRAQREREQLREQEELDLGGDEDNWEDLMREVEEKWPMVSKEIRATVLKKGMIPYY